MYLKKFVAPVMGLTVADTVSAAKIRFAPERVNRFHHSQLKEVIMCMIKKLVASLVGLNPAGSCSAANMQSLLLTFILMVAALWVSPAAIAAEKEMVRDPSTGKMVTAPEYGGTISYALKEEAASGTDAVLTGQWAQAYVAPVLEKLAIGDWATPRDEWDFVVLQFPTNAIGALAESWSQPDPLTLVVNVRQGVRWHDKPPMNGRELTADDVVFNFHRITGMGSGFTELSEWANDFKGIQFESIEATDEWTVVFRLKEISLSAPAAILDGFVSWIYPPEVIKEQGDAKDWRNLVGTGPMMLTDWTKGSSFTWERNPDYWHNDEKYPENPLPYIDRLRALIMPEVATYLAAMRTGKIDYLGWMTQSQLRTLEQAENLRKTNPEIVIVPHYERSDNAIAMNFQVEPFDDIRVRKALQMAINNEEINSAFFKGQADIVPQGLVKRSNADIATPFEEWPEEVRQAFDYDPEGAEALLDEAGYPRGTDGIRFKTDLMHVERFDLNYAQLLASYWNKIGVDVEIDVTQAANFGPRRNELDFRLGSAIAATPYPPPGIFNYLTIHGDAAYNAMFAEALAATTREEMLRICKEMNQYAIENFFMIWGPFSPQYNAVQPWIGGFNGEALLGNQQLNAVFTRLWVDSELKKAMGH